MRVTKVVYKDAGSVKAVTGKIYSEDNFFIFVEAIHTKVNFRIGKNFIISMKEIIV